MLPNPAEIQYFLEVVTTQNISRAAERLGITQPTLSLAMQRLEQTLGTPLLIRGKTGVRLTKAGARFGAQAKSLIDQWERLRAQTLSEETEVKGSVSIGCHPSVALYSTPDFIPSLMRENAELEITLQHDLSRKITERVISFELDCGITVNPVSHPDLRIVQLCTDEVQFWRGPQAEIASDVLLCDPDILQTQALLTKAKKLGPDYEFRRVIPSSSLEVLTKLCAAGAGVAILPTRVARGEASHKLKTLSSKGPVFDDRVCLIYRPDAQRSLAFKTVTKAIEASFRSGKV